MILEAFMPFSGFYESIHDDAIDHCIEMKNYDDTTGGEMPEPLNVNIDNLDFNGIRKQYAKLYTEFLADELGIKSLKFKELISPREYNFKTDSILATFDSADLNQIMLETDKSILMETIKERHTSHSGFHSFYSNDLCEWLEIPFLDWDSNMLETLLIAFINTKSSTHDIESSIIEHMSCNGHLDNIIYDNLKD